MDFYALVIYTEEYSLPYFNTMRAQSRQDNYDILRASFYSITVYLSGL